MNSTPAFLPCWLSLARECSDAYIYICINAMPFTCESSLFCRDCGYFSVRSGVLAEDVAIQFSSTIDGQPNPVEIDLGYVDSWQVHLLLLKDMYFLD